MRNLLVLIFLLGLLFTSCAPQNHLKVDPGTSIDTLNVSISFNSNIDPEITASCNEGVDIALERFNRYYNNRFHAVRSNEKSQKSLIIEVSSIKIVTDGEQINAFIGSVFGLSIPILLASAQVPFVFVLWFNPKNKIIITEKLSSDLKNSKLLEPSDLTYSVPGGWFRTRENNIKKSSKYLGNKIFKKLIKINSSLR